MLFSHPWLFTVPIATAPNPEALDPLANFARKADACSCPALGGAA